MIRWEFNRTKEKPCRCYYSSPDSSLAWCVGCTNKERYVKETRYSLNLSLSTVCRSMHNHFRTQTDILEFKRYYRGLSYERRLVILEDDV